MASLILASASPRRLEMLKRLGFPVTVVPAHIDETPHDQESPLDYVQRVAYAKASAVASQQDSSAYVLAADTIVQRDTQIFGKPENAAEALAMLETLLNGIHLVSTAFVVLQSRGHAIARVVTTEVTMRAAPADERANYVATGEWRGKAGGYAIQGMAAGFVTEVRGSVTNVIGLPLAEVLAALGTCGMKPSYAHGVCA